MKWTLWLWLSCALFGAASLAKADERMGYSYLYDILDSDQKVIGTSVKTYRELDGQDPKTFEHSNELHLKLKYFGLTIEVDETDKLRHNGHHIISLEVDGHYKLPLLSKRHIQWQGERKDTDFVITRTDGDDKPKSQKFPLADFISFARYAFDLPLPILKTATKERQKMPLIDLHEMKIIQTPYWQLDPKEISWEGKTQKLSGYGFIGKRGQLEVYAFDNNIIWETISDKVSSRLRERTPLPKP